MSTMLPAERQAQTRRASWLSQVVDLVLIELTNWRWSWRSMIVTATLAPLCSILALGLFARDSGPRALAFVLTGNVVISLMFGNMDNVQSHFVFMRFRGALDFFATLPIQRHALIVAVVLAFLLLSLPSMAITVGLGAWLLHIPLKIHPTLLGVIPMCALPLSGIGALIGVKVRTPQEGGSAALIVTLVLAGLGPVVIPPERLPHLLIALGRLSPATYAASALRQTLIGPVTPQLAVDLTILAAVAVGVFWLIGRTMDWRQQ